MDILPPILSALLGLVLIVIGAVWIHKVSKKDKMSHRFGAIMVPMLGVFFLWSTAANTLPVVIDEETEVLNVGHNWIMSRVEFNKTRNCNIKEVKASIKYSDGTEEIIKSLYLPKAKNKPGREYGYLVLQGDDVGKNAVEFHAVVSAECPFGYKVTTALDKVKIPESFNISTAEIK